MNNTKQTVNEGFCLYKSGFFLFGFVSNLTIDKTGRFEMLISNQKNQGIDILSVYIRGIQTAI